MNALPMYAPVTLERVHRVRAKFAESTRESRADIETLLIDLEHQMEDLLSLWATLGRWQAAKDNYNSATSRTCLELIQAELALYLAVRGLGLSRTSTNRS